MPCLPYVYERYVITYGLIQRQRGLCLFSWNAINGNVCDHSKHCCTKRTCTWHEQPSPHTDADTETGGGCCLTAHANRRLCLCIQTGALNGSWNTDTTNLISTKNLRCHRSFLARTRVSWFHNHLPKYPLANVLRTRYLQA